MQCNEMFLTRFYLFFRAKPRSKSLNDYPLDPQSDILDFIDQCLEQLETNSFEETYEENENRKKILDFTTITKAKLTCAKRRTKSEIIKEPSGTSCAGRVARAKSLKRWKKDQEKNATCERSRLSSVGEDKKSTLENLDSEFLKRSKINTDLKEE